MVKKLYPNYRFNSISDIDTDFFTINGIKNVILDIDNTLVPYTVSKPDVTAEKFFKRLKDENINVCLVSNNSKKRVDKFNENNGFFAASRACKPFVGAIKRAMKNANAKPEETALIGDQIFTDVWAGNRIGITTILVEPIEGKENIFFRFKRMCEKKVLEHMERNKSNV